MHECDEKEEDDDDERLLHYSLVNTWQFMYKRSKNVQMPKGYKKI